MDLDATWQQLEEMAPFYKGRPAREGLSSSVRAAMLSQVWRTVTLFTPWSNWAAEGLRRLGIEENRIAVMPPGVDLAFWQPVARGAPMDRAIRLLFVGGDFQRKGGDLLLDFMRTPLGNRFHLDIVTRDATAPAPNTVVHRLEANTPRLRNLYEAADLFVLPSRAECYGIATIEAMATGLPVVVSSVGGAADIVDHGTTGWLIRPTAADLTDRLSVIASARELLRPAGEQALIASRKLNAVKLHSELVERILRATGRFAASSQELGDS